MVEFKGIKTIDEKAKGQSVEHTFMPPTSKKRMN